MNTEIIEKDLSFQIIEAAYGVHNQLGPGFLESIYDVAMRLELKAMTEIVPIHKQQALSYLKATGLPLAIVINFGGIRLQYARVVHTKSNK